jgi:hypothetical protein
VSGNLDLSPSYMEFLSRGTEEGNLMSSELEETHQTNSGKTYTQ